MKRVLAAVLGLAVAVAAVLVGTPPAAAASLVRVTGFGTNPSNLFDVYSPQALQRGAGSDPVGIISMVDYAKSRYNVDPSRVYATGTSSGAMMTNGLPGRVGRGVGVHGRTGRLFRHHRRLDLELAVRQRPGLQDRPAVG